MRKETIKKATKEKGPFTFISTRSTYDWYEDEKITIDYFQYNYLAIERRYGPSWWLVGCRYNEYLDKWEETSIGKMTDRDIPRLIEWARFKDEYGHTESLIRDIRAIDTCLNVVDAFLKIINS